MAFTLRCRDVGVECDYVARADTEEELLKQAAKHAAEVHNMTEISDEKMAEVKAAICEE